MNIRLQWEGCICEATWQKRIEAEEFLLYQNALKNLTEQLKENRKLLKENGK